MRFGFVFLALCELVPKKNKNKRYLGYTPKITLSTIYFIVLFNNPENNAPTKKMDEKCS